MRHLLPLNLGTYRVPNPPWSPDVRPTRRMLLVFTADYLDLVAKRKQRLKPWKIRGVYFVAGLGLSNIIVSVLQHDWPWLVLHIITTGLYVWLCWFKDPLIPHLDKSIKDLQRGAGEIRALVKTRAATWLDEPATGKEQL